MAALQQARSIEEFRSLVDSGFYQSDAYLLGVDATPDFRIVSTTAGLMPVSRFSGAEVGVRREWRHIRARSSELYVIWFPIRGSVTITQDTAHEAVIAAGEFSITCGDRPFHARANADGDETCSQLHILVPSHLIRSHLPNVDRLCGHPFSAGRGPAKIARELFRELVEEQGVSPSAASQLGLGALEAIADSVRQEATDDLLQVNAKTAHLERVLRYIDQHIAMQGLTADTVAHACKLSRRYLHYLMRHHNTTFGEYLWETRLNQANRWLTDPEFRHFNIGDIAYMCGFRSASHFSNCYRTRFGRTPKDARPGV
jgi:AraC-like DNA-binding protein